MARASGGVRQRLWLAAVLPRGQCFWGWGQAPLLGGLDLKSMSLTARDRSSVPGLGLLGPAGREPRSPWGAATHRGGLAQLLPQKGVSGLQQALVWLSWEAAASSQTQGRPPVQCQTHQVPSACCALVLVAWALSWPWRGVLMHALSGPDLRTRASPPQSPLMGEGTAG